MKTVLAFLLVVSFAAPAAAEQQKYDSSRAGHPLRVAAYIAHPVGVILDTLIFRPAWWIGGFEPIRTLVGREAEPPEEGLPEADEASPAS